MKNKVTIVIDDNRSKGYARYIKDCANKILDYLGADGKYLEIVLVSQSKIKDINCVYRGKNKETNVLSFPFDVSFVASGKYSPIGEIFLSTAYVNKNKQSLEHMVVHGILHLFGFNHIKRRDRIVMEDKEREILKKIFGISI